MAVAKDLKDAIDVVSKLKVLKTEARDALQIEESDSKKEVEKAERYLKICQKIVANEGVIYE